MHTKNTHTQHTHTYMCTCTHNTHRHVHVYISHQLMHQMLLVHSSMRQGAGYCGWLVLSQDDCLGTWVCFSVGSLGRHDCIVVAKPLCVISICYTYWINQTGSLHQIYYFEHYYIGSVIIVLNQILGLWPIILHCTDMDQSLQVLTHHDK